MAENNLRTIRYTGDSGSRELFTPSKNELEDVVSTTPVKKLHWPSNNPNLFSKLRLALENGPNSAPAKQWLRFLQNPKQGVSPVELDEVPIIEDRLKEKGNEKVEKRELLELFDEWAPVIGVWNAPTKQWEYYRQPGSYDSYRNIFVSERGHTAFYTPAEHFIRKDDLIFHMRVTDRLWGTQSTLFLSLIHI